MHSFVLVWLTTQFFGHCYLRLKLTCLFFWAKSRFKWLGVNKENCIQHSAMKEKIKQEYYRRVRMVLKPGLKAANKLEAISTLTILVVAYSFNIINWKLSGTKRLNTKSRKMLTTGKIHHPKANLEKSAFQEHQESKA